MKKFFFSVVAIALVSLSSMAASPQGGVFKHLGVGVGAGTTGVSVEFSTPITRWMQLRAGMSFMPDIKIGTEADIYSPNDGFYSDVDLDLGLGRTQGSLILNIYPSPWGSFFIAGGFYFGGDKLLKIKGYSPELAQYQGAGVEIGDYILPVDKNGNIDGFLKVKNVRPYVGIGWGRPVPNRRVNFGIELGVQFMGKSKLYSNYGQITTNTYSDGENDIQKIMDKVSVYPVLTFRLNGRIF